MLIRHGRLKHGVRYHAEAIPPIHAGVGFWDGGRRRPAPPPLRRLPECQPHRLQRVSLKPRRKGRVCNVPEAVEGICLFWSLLLPVVWWFTRRVRAMIMVLSDRDYYREKIEAFWNRFASVSRTQERARKLHNRYPVSFPQAQRSCCVVLTKLQVWYLP